MAEEWNLPITQKSEQVILGDGTSVSTVGKTIATVKVGPESSDEKIHLLDRDIDTGILTLGRSWGKKHEPSLKLKDYSIVRSRADGKTLRILPKTVQQPKRTVIKQMPCQKDGQRNYKGHCELFMAFLNTSKKKCGQPTQENILSAEKVNTTWNSRNCSMNLQMYLAWNYRMNWNHQERLNSR